MPTYLRLFALVLFLIQSSCYFGYSSGKELSEANWYDSDQTLKIWALADIQPTDEGDKEAFEISIRDINENVPNVDFAIVAGDIVNKTDEEVFDWYVETRDRSYINEWYEIIGNHDLKSDMGELFREKLRQEVNYAFTKDNMLFIFMSDSERGKPTVISDETFLWWKDLVVNNQDKIIVVTTHAPLEDSGIPFSSFTDRQVIDSERFTKVLEEYDVDLWLSGHLHIPHGVMNNIVEKDKFNGTIFVHISSIRPEIMGFKDSESRVITFACGYDKVLIQSRNHEEGEFDTNHNRVFKLSKKYDCEPSSN
ncbi:MAG: metallophosphoesterase [Thermodesulfobacteriota bacterium]